MKDLLSGICTKGNQLRLAYLGCAGKVEQVIDQGLLTVVDGIWLAAWHNALQLLLPQTPGECSGYVTMKWIGSENYDSLGCVVQLPADKEAGANNSWWHGAGPGLTEGVDHKLSHNVYHWRPVREVWLPWQHKSKWQATRTLEGAALFPPRWMLSIMAWTIKKASPAIISWGQYGKHVGHTDQRLLNRRRKALYKKSKKE